MAEVLRKRLVLCIALVALILTGMTAKLAGATAAVPSRLTATGYIYVSFPTWLGNCPRGGSVKGINAAVGNLWSTPPGGDWGDDLIYPKVNFYSKNTISFQNYCKTWWGFRYLAPAWQVTFYPTRAGQTFWIGPLGQSHN